MTEPKTLKELYERQVSFEARVLEVFDHIADTLLKQERQIDRLKKKVKK